MRIARDGTWFYQGTPIGRFELVKLFSGILRKDGEKYFLVTPVEKVGIIVDDAPFVAVDCEVCGEGAAQTLTFETQVGDFALAGPDNPIRVLRDPATGEPSPYVRVRDNLDALITRSVYYELAAMAEESDSTAGNFGVWSQGTFFSIGTAAADA